jgi:HK97 gp10 family phage protein
MNIRATATFTPRSDAGRFVSSKITPAVIEATSDIAQIVLLEAQALCPVDTGALRDSGRVDVQDSGAVAVGTVTFEKYYAAYVEYGTGQRGAASPGAGPYPYSPTWPGMPAQPFLRPALDTVRSEALGEFALRMRQ